MGRGEPTQKVDFWNRVTELEETTGIPRRLAQQVAAGQLTLDGALEKLALLDRVEGMIRKHGVSRALATQVALGHADLQGVLRKVRMQAHKQANYNYSLLDEAAADGREMVYALHGGRAVTGTIRELGRYELTLAIGEGEEEIHKLAIKFAYAPVDAKRVRRATRFERAIKDAPKEPIPRPQDRYTCSDRRLFSYVDSECLVRLVTLEGELFKGQLTTMSRYEFVMKLKGGVELVVFRHALAEIAEI